MSSIVFVLEVFEGLLQLLAIGIGSYVFGMSFNFAIVLPVPLGVFRWLFLLNVRVGGGDYGFVIVCWLENGFAFN